MADPTWLTRHGEPAWPRRNQLAIDGIAFDTLCRAARGVDRQSASCSHPSNVPEEGIMS